MDAGIDPDGAFRLCVQISQFTAKIDDGTTVDMQRKYDEWIVDYRSYTMQNLQKDLAARVKWGSCQHLLISEFDMSGMGERNLDDDVALSLAFSERLAEKKLFLFVDVEDKAMQMEGNSGITEGVMSNVVTENGSAQVNSGEEVPYVIDWDSLQIEPIAEDQIGCAVPLMSEDAMYAFLGLQAEDERAEQARAELPVDESEVVNAATNSIFDGETIDNWTWFMQQLQKAIGNPPNLAISSDACKGIEKAVKAIFPWAEHRECFLHLMKNFVKQFQGPVFGRMYPAARTFQPAYHDYLMNKIYEASSKVKPYLDQHHSLLWMRSKFSEEIKCEHNTNNVAEVWNNWVKDIKDFPIAELADTLRTKFMELYAKRRKIGEKLAGHSILPIVVRQLNAMSRHLIQTVICVEGCRRW